MPATITSIAHYVPSTVCSNAELAERFHISQQWILEQTGMCERRVAVSESTSDMIVPVALACLAQAKVPPEELDCILVGTITPDRVTPSTAAIVQGRIGATKAWGFDIGAACSGFLYGLVTASHFIQAGVARRVLVCGADRMTGITDPDNRATAVLFGDGAGVALVEESDDPALGIQDSLCWVDGNGEADVLVPAGGSRCPASPTTISNREHYLQMQGKKVALSAVEQLSRITRTLMDRNGLTPENLTWFVPHQANLRILEEVAKRLGIQMDRVCITLDRYGNTSAASIPICLSEWSLAHRLSRGDKILMCSIGAGYTLAAVYLRWNEGVRSQKIPAAQVQQSNCQTN